MRSKDNTVTINERGMVTIPLEIRKKFGLIKGSKAVILEIDGKIEFIPLRSVKEMEAACTVSYANVVQEIEESHDRELRLENDHEKDLP